MRRAGLLLLLAVAGTALAAPAASASGWHSEQPLAAGIGVPAVLGEIGDIEFWAPNEGMLITAGNGGNPAGLYAFDGTGWYRYSTVCGGHEGRIAWAGPDNFWTISDQPAGQQTGSAPPHHISLCHFEGGKVVGSYAEPVGVAKSYLPLDAAACSGPDDCWFAGERLPGTTNVGAFHLHWDGTSLTAVPSLTVPQPEIEDPGRSVTSLAFHGGNLYEGVEVREGDIAPAESATQPSFFHQLFEGATTDYFIPLEPEQAIFYGSGAAKPTEMQGFRLAGDAEELWAIAGAESEPATVTALRLGGGGFEQVSLSGGVLAPGDRIDGAAAEPGGEDAWISFSESGDEASSPARLTRIHADGKVDPPTLLPAPSEGIARKGPAGPISCPALEQCWMATEQGWLFHLGPDLPQNTDPALHALVSYRPPDESLPSVPPISLPEDNSGANSPSEGTTTPTEEEPPPPKHARALLTKVHQQLIGGTVLELTFVLSAKAHVRLVAERRRHIVAETPRYTMAKGQRNLRLRLDPKRWPTKLDIQAHAIKGGAGG